MLKLEIEALPCVGEQAGICRELDKVNSWLNSNSVKDLIRAEWLARQPLTYGNLWEQSEESGYSFSLLCAGLEFK
jgi:hypothetical protein